MRDTAVRPGQRQCRARRERADERRPIRQRRADAARQPRVLMEREPGNGHGDSEQLYRRQPPHERQGAKREREAAH
jgi:hypothetical protein